MKTKRIVKSNFLLADKAAEFLADFGPVYQIKTSSNRYTREPINIVIETSLEKVPDGWVSGKHFYTSSAPKETEIAQGKKLTWTPQKKIKDLWVNPDKDDFKQWRFRADIFSKMVKDNVKPSFHKVKVDMHESTAENRKNPKKCDLSSKEE